MAETPHCRNFFPPLRKAFTLIELLVVISIIGLLAGIGVPTVLSGVRKARDSACLANLRQIGVAFLAYPADNGGYLPRGTKSDSSTGPVPYAKALYEYVPTQSGKSSGKQVNKVFLCPSEKQPPDLADSCWQYSASFALENGNSATRLTGDDGNGPRMLSSIENLSKTILLVDGKIGISSTPYMTDSSCTWNALRDDLAKSSPSDNLIKVSFRHSEKVAINVLYADGHVATLKWSDRNNTNSFSEPIWRGRGF